METIDSIETFNIDLQPGADGPAPDDVEPMDGEGGSPAAGADAEGIPGRCNAKTRKGGRCKKFPIAGRTRCRKHGGATPRGIASPNFKHGKYSSALPNRLIERYQAALEDPELLELREELALLDARLVDLIGRVDSGESGARWKAAKAAFRVFKKARVGNDEEAIIAALDDLEDVIDAGANDAAAWAELQSTIEQRRRLVESEEKRIINAKQMITTDQAMALMAAVAATIRKHVRDQPTVAAIAAELGAIMA